MNWFCQFITPSQKHHFISYKKTHNKVGRYKRLTGSCKSNDRLYNDKKKDTWTINNLRNTTQKTTQKTTRNTTQKTTQKTNY